MDKKQICSWKKVLLVQKKFFCKIFYVPELVGFQTMLIIDQKNIL